MIIVLIVTQKGGCGKSTISVNIAAELAKQKKGRNLSRFRLSGNFR
ncbi:ParA family protein [Candidatus Arsenophonus triatominarum]